MKEHTTVRLRDPDETVEVAADQHWTQIHIDGGLVSFLRATDEGKHRDVKSVPIHRVVSIESSGLPAPKPEQEH